MRATLRGRTRDIQSDEFSRAARGGSGGSIEPAQRAGVVRERRSGIASRDKSRRQRERGRELGNRAGRRSESAREGGGQWRNRGRHKRVGIDAGAANIVVRVPARRDAGHMNVLLLCCPARMTVAG
jgi:hypothetical protein